MPEIKSLVKRFLRTTFDIREGEYRKVLLMQLNIFLILVTLLIIKPVVNAQFLSTIGVEQLPLVFVLVAICAMAVSTLYARALNSRSLQTVTSVTLLISVIAITSIAILLELGVAEKPVLYLFYIGVAIFGVLSTSQFWVMANIAFDAREAKRLLSFLGAGAIAGGIAGGYITSVLVSLTSGTHVLFIAAAFLLVCIPINITLWKHYIKPLNTFQKSKRLKGFGDHPLRLIRQSRHLTYLALIVGLSVVVAKFVEFQFSSLASDAIPDPDHLTSFFGFWLSTFNVISLVIQLFITRRVVGNFGVGTSLFVLPGGLLAGSLLLIFAPVLWAGIFIKMWDISLKQSVNKAATELLALPIPANIKSQTKSFVDVFVDMAATGIGGLLLIFLINGFDLSVRAVSLLTIVILGIWIWVAFKVRGEYLQSFKARLTQADKKTGKSLPDFSSSSVLDGLRKVMREGTDSQVLWVLKKVEEIPDKRLFENVARFLDSENADLRQQALRCIYYLRGRVNEAKLMELLHDTNQEVRYDAFRQLMRQTTNNRMTILHNYLVHEDPLVSGAALVALAEESRNNPEMQRVLRINSIVQDKLDYLDLIDDPGEKKHYQTIILRTIGHARLQPYYSVIEQYMNDDDPYLVGEAVRAAGKSMDARFVERLIRLLVRKNYREDVRNALYEYGPGVIEHLALAAKKPDMPPEVAAFIPFVLERFASQTAVDALFDLLDQPDASLRQEVLRSLNTLKKTHPRLDIRQEKVIELIISEVNLYKDTLAVLYRQSQMIDNDESEDLRNARLKLIAILEQRLDSTLERIFRLLGLKYPPEDIMPVFDGIRNSSNDIRINSVEFLDNLLEPRLKKVLIPIAETAMLDAITREVITNLNVKVPDEEWCFTRLLQGKDPNLKVAVFNLIGQMGNSQYIDLVQQYTNNPFRRVREAAENALAGLVKRDS